MRREDSKTKRVPLTALQSSGRRSHVRIGVLVAGIALSATNLGVASGMAQEFRDSFNSPGPLPGTLSSHPYEIKNGVWTVTDADIRSSNPATASNRVLVQGSKAITPNEPLVFVRGHSFREVTAEVTFAMMDPLDQFGTLPPGASAGIVVRAPIDQGVADPDNFYLFSAFSTGVLPQYPTGKALGLFKRIARGYELLDSQVVHTWADLTRPHRYKLVMGRGQIRAYFDNRLVINHTDIPSPDYKTPSDPFPGLPFDQGAVGLRTSATRAWFDDLVVVGNDAYEGRAYAGDVYTQFGESTQARRGDAVTVSQLGQTYGASRLDTGFTYGASSVSSAAIRAMQNPFNPDAEFGATINTSSKNGAAVSTVRLAGGEIFVQEPMNRSISATLVSKGVESVATASCDAASSRVVFTDSSLTVRISNDPVLPDMTLGPFPLATEYAPNTIIYERAGVISIIAHSSLVTAAPRRVEAAALRISIPDGGVIYQQPVDTQIPNVTTVRTPGAGVPIPPLEMTIAGVTAGRYCR